MMKGIKAVASQILLVAFVVALALVGAFFPSAASASYTLSYVATPYTQITVTDGPPLITTANHITATITIDDDIGAGGTYCFNPKFGYIPSCPPISKITSAVMSDGVTTFDVSNGISVIIGINSGGTPVVGGWEIAGLSSTTDTTGAVTVTLLQTYSNFDSADNGFLIEGPAYYQTASSTGGVWTCTSGCAPPPPPPIIASTLPNGSAGVAYPSTLLVSGGTAPYSISATGLPPGLSVGTDGKVSGTPDATDSGTYKVTVSVTDSASAVAGPQTVSIYITPVSSCGSPPVCPVPGDLPGTLNETEGPYSGVWTLNSSGGYNATWNNGAIATITVSSFTSGSVVLNRTDTSASTSAGLTAVYTGQVSSTDNSIVNGSVTFTWPGVAGYPSTGTWTASWSPQSCSAPPAAVRGSLIRQNARDSSANATGQCTPLKITTRTLPPAQAYSLSQPRAPTYSAQLMASGGSGEGYVFAVTGLPAGLHLTGADIITGSVTSRVPDTYNISVSVTDSAGNTGTTQEPLALPTICGDPTVNASGDDRDVLIKEYFSSANGGAYKTPVAFNVNKSLHPPSNVVLPSAINAPHCDQFTDEVLVTPSYPTFCDFTSKQLGGPFPDYCKIHKWTIIREPEVAPAMINPNGPGIESWLLQLRHIGDSKYRMINSSYRDPTRNLGIVAASGVPAAPKSPHMQGNAIDLQNISMTHDEYQELVNAALATGSTHVETFYEYCQNRCVHAQWTKESGSYINP